ncbi:MAG: hypothetical protein ACRD1Z_07975, partial [Vicinamibacteria bacterium]
MTVSAGNRKISYVGTGANTVLAVSFPFFEANDLAVQKRVTSTGVVTVLTEGVHYSVGIPANPPGTGTVTPINGAADFPSSVTWTIVRTTDRAQQTDYVENDAFPAETHEAALDRLTLIAQETDDEVTRSLRIPTSDSSSISTLLPSSVDRATKLLQFDASGNPTAVLASTVIPGSVTFSSIGQSIATAANAAAERTLLQIDRVVVGTAAARAALAAVDFGVGIFLESDTGRLYRSDAAAWTEEGGVRQDLFASLPSTSGRVGIATDRKALYRGTGAAKVLLRALPPRWLQGLGMVRNGARTIDLSPGSARNSLASGAGNADDDLDIVLAALMNKNLNAAWSLGG